MKTITPDMIRAAEAITGRARAQIAQLDAEYAETLAGWRAACVCVEKHQGRVAAVAKPA